MDVVLPWDSSIARLSVMLWGNCIMTIFLVVGYCIGIPWSLHVVCGVLWYMQYGMAAGPADARN